MEIITRDLEKEFLEMSKKYPIVTLIGPRQSGKTTLIRRLFQHKKYVTLEDLDERDLARSDPRGFLARFPDGVILDEIQRLPELLSYIQGIVDQTDKKGLFILTGSHQLSLHESIAQSLAGRTAILKLLPFEISEIAKITENFSLDDYLYHGMYPRIYKDDLNPTKFYRDYMQTYIERDVRQMVHIKDLTLFQRFLKLCAGRVGQLFNSHQLGNELGISYHTINNWLSILEASFVIFRLNPYFENFGKRIIKSSKIYFTDVGLATYLLDIVTVEQVSRDPLRGNLVENFMMTEFLKQRLNQGFEPNFYFYRDSNQHEIDLIFKNGNMLIPIEMKAAQTFHPQFLKGLEYFKQLVGKKCELGYLVYAGLQEQKINDFFVVNFKHIEKIL